VSTPRVILVVEDDTPVRGYWRTALTLAGFDVLEAQDGIQALRILEQYLPDLVVLDLGLPKLSGVSVRQEIAAQVVTRYIPVVVVTGSTEQDLTYLDVPCVLRKPVSSDQLVGAVRTWLPSGASGLGA
jgi:DNA-binding response OmpR family regulator